MTTAPGKNSAVAAANIAMKITGPAVPAFSTRACNATPPEKRSLNASVAPRRPSSATPSIQRKAVAFIALVLAVPVAAVDCVAFNFALERQHEHPVQVCHLVRVAVVMDADMGHIVAAMNLFVAWITREWRPRLVIDSVRPRLPVGSIKASGARAVCSRRTRC